MSTNYFDGKVAAITGAGSGIGRALAIALSARGARLALSDVSDTGLKETAALCQGETDTWIIDVSDEQDVEAFAALTIDRFGVAHQIYNNAGIGCTMKVAESQWSDYKRVLGVNLNGTIHGTQAFLPHLIASGDGHVVNISSLNGILAQPQLSHYCASKFAVRGFTESLRAEALLDHLPIKVSVVHPGGVATNIATNTLKVTHAAGRTVSAAAEARSRTYTDSLLKMTPETAAQIILRGVERGKPRIRVGKDAVAADLAVRLLPSLAARLAVAVERKMLKYEQT